MATPAKTPNGAPLILVAEDEAVTRRLVTFKLERSGFAVAHASNGEELLTLTRQRSPALIILDIMMPVKDGFTTLCALREDAALAATPVIMLSGKTQEADVVRCLKAGATDYVVKPFSPDELVARVRKLLES